MFYLIIYGVVPLVVAAIVVLAIWTKRYWLRLSTLLTLLTLLVLRESSIYAHTRSLVRESGRLLEQDAVASFADGARAVADYCSDTGLLVYFVYAAIAVICARGFRQSGKQ